VSEPAILLITKRSVPSSMPSSKKSAASRPKPTKP